MKPWIFLPIAFLSLSHAPFSPAADAESLSWQEALHSPMGTYSVHVKEKKVEVVRTDPAEKKQVPYLRLKVHRKDRSPLEVRLQTLETPDEPLRYTGHISPWNRSIVGFTLEMSFDKKTWTRLGQSLKRGKP
jgi:hypothetical protein